jgi:ribosomal protein S18 acetylase RimI-like enzyme
MKPTVTLGDAWNAELDAFLAERIYEFNASATGHADGRALTATVNDERGRRIAAASGHTWGGTCQLTSLWVEASHRRAGLGSALLRAVEDEARRRGCAQVVLLTHDFQAPAFYERHGYRRVGEIDGYPSGHAQLVYAKPIARAA